MWQGVFPAVTTKFNEDGSLGEAVTLGPAEKLENLAIGNSMAGKLPVLMMACAAASATQAKVKANGAERKRVEYVVAKALVCRLQLP